MTRRANYMVGFAMIATIMSFFFYMGVIRGVMLEDEPEKIKTLQMHQIKLLRDLHKYHHINDIEYTSLAETADQIKQVSDSLEFPGKPQDHPQLTQDLTQLKKTITDQQQSVVVLKKLGLDLSTNKNIKKSTSLVNNTIADIDRLGVEAQITNIDKAINALHIEHKQNAQIFNTLLFICSLYLFVYIIILFVTLQRSKNTLAQANYRLSNEVKVRTQTENALYKLVETSSENREDEDYIRSLLEGLCESLGVKYAYLSYVGNTENEAIMVGIVSGGNYQTDIHYNIKGSPCEEVLKEGRLVYDSELINYFPEWDNEKLSDAECYIGVTLSDNDEDIHGLLAIAHNQSITNTNLAESILTLAASRASTELIRKIESKNSKHYQQGLEMIDNWMAKIISTGHDTEIFFEDICMAAQQITNATLVALPISNRGRNTYTIRSATGKDAYKLIDTELSLDDGGLCSWVMQNDESVRINDIKYDIRAQKQLASQFSIKSALATPITINSESYGAIVVFHEISAFNEIDEQLLNQFSQSVQMAIINMELLSDIKSEKERAEVTLHSIGDAVITTNANGDIEYMNHVAEQLTHWTLEEVRSKPVQVVFRILDQDTREPIHNLVETCLKEGTAISKSMTKLIAKDGTEKEIENSMSPILNAIGKPEGVVIVFHDETERRRMEHLIKHQATHDTLTGLANRNEFDRQLTEHIYDAKHNGREHALCYLDLDRFKLVNDTAGHAVGDQLLKEITTLLHSCIRGGDALGRLGGDEFGLLLENCPQDSALHIAEKITDEISNYQFSWNDKVFTIGVSIGLVPINENSISTSEVMKRADIACYTAKDHGRNRVYIYEHEDSELIRRQEEMHWATRISDTLDNNRLILYAQAICPLNNIRDDKSRLEILVRMEDNEGNLIPPSAFIPAAERYNLMGAVDKRIINDTFKHIAAQSDALNALNICYSINLSGNSLNTDDFSSYVKELLSTHGVNAENICFEITETAAITNLFKAKKLMEELKEVGCYFALDDFGSGLSSFEYLRSLPVDYLKIDGSFVRDMVNNKIDHAMVAAINQVGHVMDILTIAEFVENERIMLKLKKLKVDYAQGYGISRPMPLEDITEDDFNFNTTVSAKLA